MISPDLVDQTARFAAELDRLAPQPGRVLLAVSGGPDSMAMLTLAAAGDRVVAVATVDHRMRVEAAGEAAMVARQCATLGLSHATLSPDTAPAGSSLQAQARGVRYRLLADHARAIGAAAIATAHHVEDQAETFLMRAARGSGVGGLAGVRAAVTIEGVPVVRPLLDWRRAELRAIVRRAEIPFVDDPANADPRHDRTRFRLLLDANEWLDAPAIARAAGAVAEADADLAGIADWLWRDRATVAVADISLHAGDLPRAVARRLVARAVGRVRSDAGIETPAWTPSAAIEPLLDALFAGSRATKAGVLASPGKGLGSNTWRFRPAPPRR